MIESENRIVKPWSRITILVIATIAIGVLAYALTGTIIPRDPGNSLIFQNALLLVILGSALLEAKFTKPADSAVNSLMAAITLLSVFGQSPSIAWWAVLIYCIAVFILASTCVAVSSGPTITGWQERVAKATYKPAVLLGGARRLYSVVFLFAVFSLYSVNSKEAAILVVFWGLFIVLWPLRVPELLSMFSPRKSGILPIGRVIRTDWPDVVRCEIRSDVNWTHEHVKIYNQADKTQRIVLPLYSQVKENAVLGTGLCIGNLDVAKKGMDIGYIYDYPDKEAKAAQWLGGSATSKLVGFIVEDSDIGQIRFETWDPSSCTEGMLVWCQLNGKKVFYQIVNGITREETLEAERHGFQVAIATELGVLDTKSGFSKFNWLPAMNTPVFSEPASFGSDIPLASADDFVYGKVPGSEINVSGDFAGTFDHHTAILGVTGSGKTELAFDMIRHAAEKKIKVLCIDLTARYEGKLADLTPRNLSIPSELVPFQINDLVLFI